MAPRRLFWSAVWLAVALVGIKTSHLRLPRTPGGVLDYLQSMAAISYRDVALVIGVWAIARVTIALASKRPRLSRTVEFSFIGLAAVLCIYSVASMVAFRVLGGFPTYALLKLVGSVRMISSSVAAFLSAPVVTSLILVPIGYLIAVRVSASPNRRTDARRGVWTGLLCFAAIGWTAAGYYVFATEWKTHWDWRVAENPPWVLATSFVRAIGSGQTAELSQSFSPDDLADFQPLPPRAVPARARNRRPPNVILVVLESVAARWTGISSGQYETTPTLRAESAHGITFDSFYSHVGRSSNSLASILLSTYTKLDFVDYTEEYGDAHARSLATILADRGYATAFMTSSNMAWADWNTFVEAHGFSDVRDDETLPCDTRVTSWGLADSCVVDGMIDFVNQNKARPFFVMAWTQQTHHPYEPTPGTPTLSLVREPNIPDEYNLGRYLNVLHETDRQLARLFEAIRAHGLADDTIVVVTGDHGQAFGYPHNSYMQGKNVYEEDLHVPLLIWSPRQYRKAAASPTIGGLVDLAPTIAELAGIAPAPDWQGRSLFDKRRAPRAYFYVAQDEFKLGVREENWKYILDLRSGAEELYDLSRDRIEWDNVASKNAARSTRLRQRLAAWTEANRRQFAEGEEVRR